jgi:hypothetical protein
VLGCCCWRGGVVVVVVDVVGVVDCEVAAVAVAVVSVPRAKAVLLPPIDLAASVVAGRDPWRRRESAEDVC